MIITVKAFATLRTLMQNETRVELGGESTIAVLLGKLETLYPGLSGELFSAPGQINPLVNILKNGRNIQHLANLQTSLEDGDTVALFPPAAGG
jgi:molybdopterin synthase sulfur carrier subunit